MTEWRLIGRKSLKGVPSAPSKKYGAIEGYLEVKWTHRNYSPPLDGKFNAGMADDILFKTDQENSWVFWRVHLGNKTLHRWCLGKNPFKCLEIAVWYYYSSEKHLYPEKIDWHENKAAGLPSPPKKECVLLILITSQEAFLNQKIVPLCAAFHVDSDACIYYLVRWVEKKGTLFSELKKMSLVKKV